MTSTATSLGKSNYSEFYDAAPPEPHLLYQGEILVDVPVLSMPKPTRWLLLRTQSGKTIHDALQNGNLGGRVKVLDSNMTAIMWDAAGVEGDYAIGLISKRPVLVLSQTCDVQNKDFIQVAPIYKPQDESYIGKLTRGEVISAFRLKPHLPDWNGEMYADLEQIQAIHKSYRKSPPRHFRLSQSSVLHLQRAITKYFGRPNSFRAGDDRAPRSATYLCTQCIYRDALVTKLELQNGEDFTNCPACDGVDWIIQLGSLAITTRS